MAVANKRIEYIDFIKGICIFLVVWGHSIQNMGNNNDFWENPVHVFICSFHMPIFMVVSGFFFSKSIGSPLVGSLRKRFTQLIVPCFGWSIILVIIGICYQLRDGLPISPIDELKLLVQETCTRFWFLRSVFICFTLSIISMKIFKKDMLAFVLSFALLLLLPDNGRIHFDKFMYPFFWMGYFMHKHIESIMKYRTQILILSLVAFVTLILFWNREDYIYVTGMSLYNYQDGMIEVHPLLDRITIILYRYLIGAFGSLFVFLCLQRIYNARFKSIEKVGTYTLGIYTIHILIEGNLLKLVDLSHLNFFVYNFIITPLVSVALIVLCIGIIKLLEYNKWSNLLFLGKAFGILIACMLCVSCIKEKSLYIDGEFAEKNIISQPPFFYNYANEVKNPTGEITINLNQEINANQITVEVPPLKYNKSWLFMLTQEGCAQSAYSCTWAAINGKPLSQKFYYDTANLQAGDFPPDAYNLGKTLGSTDGAGNEVRFAITTTLAPEMNWMNVTTNVHKKFSGDYYRFFMKSGLVWGNVKEMLNYGCGIAYHYVNSNDESNVESIVNHYNISQYITAEYLSGRKCKTAVVPDDKQAYMEAAKNSKEILTIATQNITQAIYPFTVADDLIKTPLREAFATNVKDIVTQQLQLPKEDRKAIYFGVHFTDSYWVDILKWINDNYGKDGDDSVWFPAHEEYFEYNYYRQNGVFDLVQQDRKTLKLKISLPMLDTFYYPSVTVNLKGITKEQVASIIPGETISGFSYNAKDSSLTMNIDLRKYLLEHATHFVEQYEKDKSNASNKADALCFVNLLKDSDKKTKLLNRLK